MMAERNVALPEAKRILYRMGINLGDILIDGEDILGDGVNVAARLEGICEPGGICLSEDVYRQAHGRIETEFVDLGDHNLKNIARPVRTHALTPAAIAAAKATDPESAPGMRGGLKRLSAVATLVVVVVLAMGAFVWRESIAMRLLGVSVAEDKLKSAPRLSIVVLPFENLSDDPEQEYFADGITDDLTTDLSHIDRSFVIARNTAFTYKGKPVDAKQIGRELGVRYVLEGSVRRVGVKITVNAQLISTDTGAHVWADRFEGERSKLGDLQVEFVSRLANSLGAELVKAEALRAARERPDNPDAADLAMQGWAIFYSSANRSGAEDTLALFERALALDPQNVRALIGVTSVLSSRVVGQVSKDPEGDLARAEKAIDAAITLQPDSSLAHSNKGWVFS